MINMSQRGIYFQYVVQYIVIKTVVFVNPLSFREHYYGKQSLFL